MSILICLYSGWSFQCENFNSLSNSTFNLSRKSSHICSTASVNDTYFFSTETFCCADSVHRNITATDDSNFLSGKIRALIFSDITKERYGGDHAFCMLAFDTKLLISACTDGNKNSIVFLAQTLNCDIFTDTFSKFYLNSGLKDCLNVFIQTIFRKSVVRDTVAEHSAELWKHLEYGCLMSHQLQVVSSTESTRSSTYNSDTLSGGRCAFRWRNFACIVSGHTFQSTDIDGIIYDISTAAGLTRMLADKTAGCRERIILTDQTNFVGVTPLSGQCNISWDINMCRTKRNARYRLCIVAGTASLTDMFLIIFATVS